MTREEYRIGRRWAGLPRWRAYLVVLCCYAIAAAGAALVAVALRRHHPVTVAFVADLVATAVVFLASMALANSSLYDPYWSAAPPLIAFGWVAPVTGTATARHVAVLILVTVWAVRLTANWALSWRSLGQEDWRYVKLRADSAGRLPWWLVSLTGIQAMPTLVVFLALLPLWPALATGARPWGLLDVLAVLVTGAAIVIEATADVQLRRFAADPANRRRPIDRGLWAYSRHPNYLGEIAFWWGIWLFGVAAAPSWWWTVIGPLVMVLLFESASIPLMERRLLAGRPGYADRIVAVPRLLPRPWRSRPAPAKADSP